MQQDIAETCDEAQRKYEEETKGGSRSESSLRVAITVAMDAKRHKLNAPFMKHLAIVNPYNRILFLMEVNLLCYLKLITLLCLVQNILFYYI